MGVRRASFAPPEQTAELTGMEIGGVTPFGLPQPLNPVRVDAAVLSRQRVVVGGGDRSVKLVVESRVFSRAPLFQIVEGLRYAFPKRMKAFEREIPGLVDLRDRVAARPNIKAYLLSDRRIAFNEDGIFRRYKALDI